MPKSSNKNLNAKLDDVIHGNDIITYGMAVMDNFNLINAVITTNIKTEIMILSEDKFLNNDSNAVSSRTYY